MAKLGSITINEIEMIEVDASPIVDGFDAPSGSLAILTDGTAMFLKITGGPTAWQSIGSFGTTDHTALTNLTTGDSGHTQFVMTDGSKAMSSGLSITSAANQLTLSSSTNQLILTSGTSAAARTYTIPDVGPTGVLAMLEGTQTFSGSKTFSNAPTFSSLLANQALYLNGAKLLTGVTLSNGNLLVGATGSTPVVGSITTDANLTSTFTSPNIVISLNNSGVTAATYGSTTQVPQIAVDAKGRITSASNVTITPANIGAQPVDATLTSLAAYNTNGILTQTAADTFTGRTITGTASNISVTNGNGVAGNPTIDLINAGTAGTYGSSSQVPVITTDSKGRVTSVTNSNIQVSESQVTNLTSDLSLKANLSGGNTFTGNQTINGVVTVGGTTIQTSGEWNVAAGTYTDPDVGTLYDAKFGGPNKGIAVTGTSLFKNKLGVGINTPNSSAKLQVDSTTEGVLVPRMTTAQRLAIVSPSTGLLVYDISDNAFWYFDGNFWTCLSGIYKSVNISTLSSTSNVTLTNITGMEVSVINGKSYLIEAYLLFRSVATATGIALSVGTTGASGTIFAQIHIPVGANGTAGELQGQMTSFSSVVIGTGVQTANTTYIARITGIFTCTTSGTIYPQFRSEINGSSVTILPNSRWNLREV